MLHWRCVKKLRKYFKSQALSEELRRIIFLAETKTTTLLMWIANCYNEESGLDKTVLIHR
jgi:hypothetical protein